MISLLIVGTLWCLLWYGLGRKHGFEEGVEHQKNAVSPRPVRKFSDPVFQDRDKWYFWDETWSEARGPFDTEIVAREALKDYVETL